MQYFHPAHISYEFTYPFTYYIAFPFQIYFYKNYQYSCALVNKFVHISTSCILGVFTCCGYRSLTYNLYLIRHWQIEFFKKFRGFVLFYVPDSTLLNTRYQCLTSQ